jgi:ApbE superfamily uncharacterized protein (UPF0280 family)
MAFRELANCFASSRRKLHVSPEAYGRGGTVGGGRGVGVVLGVGDAIGVGVAVAVAVAVADAAAVAVAVAVGVGEGPQGLTGQLKISIDAMMVRLTS